MVDGCSEILELDFSGDSGSSGQPESKIMIYTAENMSLLASYIGATTHFTD